MADSLVTVCSCFSVEEAYVLKNLLEAEGITVFLADEITTGFAWHLSNAIGGVKLQVPAEQADRAAALLAKPEHRLAASEIDALAETPEPSECEEDRQDLQSASEEPDSEAADSEPDAVPELPGDAIVRRAWNTAIVGIFVCPPTLHLYSLWLLARLALSNREVSPSVSAKQAVAFLIDLLFVFIGYLVFRSIMS